MGLRVGVGHSAHLVRGRGRVGVRVRVRVGVGVRVGVWVRLGYRVGVRVWVGDRGQALIVGCRAWPGLRVSPGLGLAQA